MCLIHSCSTLHADIHELGMYIEQAICHPETETIEKIQTVITRILNLESVSKAKIFSPEEELKEKLEALKTVVNENEVQQFRSWYERSEEISKRIVLRDSVEIAPLCR